MWSLFEGNVRHDRPKQLWVRSLETDASALLCSAVLPEPWCQYEKPLPVQCGISTEHLPSRMERFGDLSDSRKGQGKRHRLRTPFAIIGCAKLYGKPGEHRAICNYAQTMTKPQRRAVHCWINPHTGEYEVSSESSFYRALKTVTPQQIQAVLDPWLDQIVGPVDRQEPVARTFPNFLAIARKFGKRPPRREFVGDGNLNTQSGRSTAAGLQLPAGWQDLGVPMAISSSRQASSLRVATGGDASFGSEAPVTYGFSRESSAIPLSVSGRGSVDA